MVSYYPSGANVSPDNYSIVSSVTYTSTGATSSFNIGRYVGSPAEVAVVIDGIVQAYNSYTLSNSKGTVDFLVAPGATSLEIKTLTVPEYLKISKQSTQISPIFYSNTSALSVNGNTYTINGSQVAWALPSIPSDTNQMLVSVDGVVQNPSAYTFPSSTLGSYGIDISPALASNVANLDVRVFSGTSTQIERFTTMTDRKPDRGFSTDKQFDTLTFESQAGYETRRLRSRRPRRNYNLTYTNISGVHKIAIDNFYNARSGDYESFVFDLSHINDSGQVTVRFDGPVQTTHVASAGTQPSQNFYTVSMKLKEVFS
jgi:hypothetical protein